MTDNCIADKQNNVSGDQCLNSPYQNTLMSLKPKFREQIEQILKMTFNIEQINNLIDDLNSDDILLQHQGCIGIRKLLSVQDCRPIQIIIDAKCVPCFIEFTKQTIYPVLQLIASSCLINIADGTIFETLCIINHGAIPLFCNLLNSSFQDIQDQAICFIGKISAEFSHYRDMILQSNGLKLLANILLNTNDRNMIKHCIWALRNICIKIPLPLYVHVKDSVLPICKVLMLETDSEVITDCTQTLQYFSLVDEERIQCLISTGIIPTLIRLISHQNTIIIITCLRILGNICFGTEEQVDTVLINGSLAEITKLIQHDQKLVRKNACQVLCQIACGNESQVSQLIDQHMLVTNLFECMLNDCEEDVTLEATYVISNCIADANFIIINKMYELNILQVYTKILKTKKNAKMLNLILDSLKSILECGKQYLNQERQNSYGYQLLGSDAIDFIENLQLHHDVNIYQRSQYLLQNYFQLDDEKQC